MSEDPLLRRDRIPIAIAIALFALPLLWLLVPLVIWELAYEGSLR